MTLIIQITAAFIIGLLIVYRSIPAIVKLANEKKLFDIPNERKVNKTVIPNLGGVALFIGITIATLLGIHKYDFPDLRYILSGMIIMFFVGMKDDILIISAYKKLIAQILAAVILVVMGNIRFTNLHGLFGIHEINYVFSSLISITALVAIMNAYNLIDGIDGLAGSLGLIGSLFYGMVFLTGGHPLYAVLCFAISGSLISFLSYNIFGRKNKIFMGDTGSLLLGLLMAIFTIKFNEFSVKESWQLSRNAPILSFAVIAFPLFDMIRVFGERIIQKKSPFTADMIHIHHKLLKLGLTHLQSTLILVFTSLGLILMCLILWSVNVYLQVAMIVSLMLVLSFAPDLVYEYIKSKRSVAKRFTLSYIFMPFKDFEAIKTDLAKRTGNRSEIELKSDRKKEEKIA